jgi:hypothetical protein
MLRERNVGDRFCKDSVHRLRSITLVSHYTTRTWLGGASFPVMSGCEWICIDGGCDGYRHARRWMHSRHIVLQVEHHPAAQYYHSYSSKESALSFNRLRVGLFDEGRRMETYGLHLCELNSIAHPPHDQ